jgi:hypothetical protein
MHFISLELISIGITNLKTRDFANGITAAQPKIRHINDALCMPYIYFSLLTVVCIIFLIPFRNIHVSYTNAFSGKHYTRNDRVLAGKALL